jgi:dihydropteroate synthase
MHKEPQSMQTEPMQGDADSIVTQVLLFLEQRSQQLQSLNINSKRISIDVGTGFGKTVAQNFALLSRQKVFLKLGLPILSGWSRKSALGAVTGFDMPDRMPPSIVAAVLAVQQGASIVRVHDVRETKAALQILSEVRRYC